MNEERKVVSWIKQPDANREYDKQCRAEQKERTTQAAAGQLRCLRARENALLSADVRMTAKREKLLVTRIRLRGGQDGQPLERQRELAEHPRQRKRGREPD